MVGVFDPVGFQDAWEYDSHLFFTPELETLVLQRPDGYVTEVPIPNQQFKLCQWVFIYQVYRFRMIQ